MRAFFLNSKGLTILEALVASAILGMLVLGVSAIYIQSNRIYQTITEESRMQEISSQIINTLVHGKEGGTESLMGAVHIDAALTDRITFTDKEGTQVEIYHADDTVYKIAGGGEPVDLNLNNLVKVKEFELKYFNPDEVEVTDPNEVTKIKLTIKLESNSSLYSSRFVSEIKLRNLYDI